MAAIVELKGIAATFPGADLSVFSDIDLAIERGEFVIVVGASGGRAVVVVAAARREPRHGGGGVQQHRGRHLVAPA